MKYSHKHFSDYLSNETSCTVFLQPTDKEEIANIISSLNPNKASGPNSIYTLQNIISIKKNFFLKKYMYFTKYTLFAEKMFVYGKKVLY